MSQYLYNLPVDFSSSGGQLVITAGSVFFNTYIASMTLTGTGSGTVSVDWVNSFSGGAASTFALLQDGAPAASATAAVAPTSLVTSARIGLYGYTGPSNVGLTLVPEQLFVAIGDSIAIQVSSGLQAYLNISIQENH